MTSSKTRFAKGHGCSSQADRISFLMEGQVDLVGHREVTAKGHRQVTVLGLPGTVAIDQLIRPLLVILHALRNLEVTDLLQKSLNLSKGICESVQQRVLRKVHPNQKDLHQDCIKIRRQ